MPFEALLEALEADTAARVAKIGLDARAEAARLRGEDAAAHDARVAEEDRSLTLAVERGLEPTRQEARRAVLEARHRLLDRVYAAALEALDGAEASDAWREALSGTLDAALACVRGPAVIRCRPAIADLVRGLVGDRPARVEPVPGAAPGLVVSAEDGSVTIDGTLTDRLRDLRLAAARDLAGGAR